MLSGARHPPSRQREDFVRTHLLSTAIVLVSLFSGPATAGSIGLSNPYFRSWNGVIVHRPGDGFSSFLVNEGVATNGPDADLSTDLGFATVAALSEALSLHPASAVDATEISSLGYDYVIAEATTWYEADLIIAGGSGAVEVLLEAFEDEASFTNESGFALASSRSIRIFDGASVIYGMSRAAESDLVTLEYGVTYRLQMIFSAYSRATAGHETWNSRDLALAFTIVPEPNSAALVAFGLAVLVLRGRRPTRR